MRRAGWVLVGVLAVGLLAAQPALAASRGSVPLTPRGNHLAAASGGASWQGGWGHGAPIGGYSVFRGVRAKLARNSLTWQVTDDALASTWISVEGDASHDFIQIGYWKTGAGTTVGCDNGNTTVGDVKVFIEVIHADMTHACHIGPIVSAGETHDLRIQRCGGTSTDWCGYIDGTLLKEYTLNISSGTLVKARAEFSCFSCSFTPATDLSYVQSFWGGSVPFSVTDTGTSGSDPWANVTPSGATKTDFPADGWSISPIVNGPTHWDIDWDRTG